MLFEFAKEARSLNALFVRIAEFEAHLMFHKRSNPYLKEKHIRELDERLGCIEELKSFDDVKLSGPGGVELALSTIHETQVFIAYCKHKHAVGTRNEAAAAKAAARRR